MQIPVISYSTDTMTYFVSGQLDDGTLYSFKGTLADCQAFVANLPNLPTPPAQPF